MQLADPESFRGVTLNNLNHLWNKVNTSLDFMPTEAVPLILGRKGAQRLMEARELGLDRFGETFVDESGTVRSNSFGTGDELGPGITRFVERPPAAAPPPSAPATDGNMDLGDGFELIIQ